MAFFFIFYFDREFQDKDDKVQPEASLQTDLRAC